MEVHGQGKQGAAFGYTKSVDTEIIELDARRTVLAEQVAPDLLKAFGVRPHIAATLLVTAGDNPERLHNEASFAGLCGVAPIPAGSGKTDGYHRLHRGGDQGSVTTANCSALVLA